LTATHSTTFTISLRTATALSNSSICTTHLRRNLVSYRRPRARKR
jgi:hypothetical protein